MRIAWFTPFAPKSAIGHYSEAIVAELAAADEVTLFVPGGAEHGPARPTALPVVVLPDDPPEDVAAVLDGFDLVVYNLGNHLPFHLPIYEAAARRPGVVVLHDLVMRDFFYCYYLVHRRDPEGFARCLGLAHGPEAGAAGREIAHGRRPELPDDPERLAYPMFPPAVRGALGVVTHSDYSRRRVAEAVPVPAEAIDFPIYGPCAAYAHAPPARRPPAGDRVRVLTFGVLTPNKLVHATVRAIGATPGLRRAVRFEVIGSGEPRYEQRLRGLIRDHDLGDTVALLGWQSDDALRAAVAAADVVVNLRNPHCGESSASLLTSLLAGVVTVVWDHGSYAEFPDDVVVKVRSEAELPAALERLVRSPELRRAYGERARAHALERFDTRRYCDRLRAFAREVHRTRPVLRLADTVSGLLAELGASEVDGLVDRMGEVIGGLAPHTPP